jgi:putative ABC transport system permease protein
MGIVRMLSVEFLMLIFIACLIATPIAWYFMQQWLQRFAFRIAVEPWMFIVASFVAVVIAFITIGIKSIKSALINPIDSLRNE